MIKSLFLKAAALIGFTVMLASCSSAGKEAPGDIMDPADFETEVDGKAVALYTITNGKITAQVTNYGGYIVGIYAPDRNGEYENVVGHNDNISQYLTFSRNPVGSALGRYANRIAHASFTLDGVTYQLTKNAGEHMLHGGRKTLGNTIWDVEKVTDNAVVMSCTLDDGQDGFPGTFRTTLTFSVTKDNGVSIDFKATTDKPTVCNLSHHAYFNLNGFDTEDILGHILKVNADYITETDNALIPTGKLLPVDGTPYDFRKEAKIGDRQVATAPAFGMPAAPVPDGMVSSYDNNFCLNHKSGSKVESVATLYAPESGRFMEVLNNHPGMQVYTGNRKAIALESQMYPDAPNHPEFPSATLRPGETYSHTIIYKFSVRK